ncbi:hypothetical protein RB195_000987 [Necator americanus]|uniref:Uncharacterized protein n=1 Tax=Necator americanus TaxID=51031 RepID=A0ABR1DF62_NECAM
MTECYDVDLMELLLCNLLKFIVTTYILDVDKEGRLRGIERGHAHLCDLHPGLYTCPQKSQLRIQNIICQKSKAQRSLAQRMRDKVSGVNQSAWFTNVQLAYTMTCGG